MAQPVEFTIKAEDHVWIVARDGHDVGRYSHLEQATHEAVRIARELEETGQPARVLVHAAHGKVVEVDVGPEVTREQERRGGDTVGDDAPEPDEDA